MLLRDLSNMARVLLLLMLIIGCTFWTWFFWQISATFGLLWLFFCLLVVMVARVHHTDGLDAYFVESSAATFRIQQNIYVQVNHFHSQEPATQVTPVLSSKIIDI